MASEYTPGATGWDVLIQSGDKVRSAALALFVLAALWVCSSYVDTELIEGFVIGLILGWLITSYLSRPIGRLVLVVPRDFRNEHIRLVWIPEEHYSQFNASGNGYALTSSMGMPLYIATSIDVDAKTIDYGWTHELNIAQVYAYEDLLHEFLDDAESAMVDNLKLSQHPRLYGARLAREPVEFVASEFGALAGISGMSFPDSSDEMDIVAMARRFVEASEQKPLNPEEAFS
ncbi:MAG: hypothetical protein Q4Q62_05990 [Thermoplasmata archaeon]|nr:hypothetical protein [Thermoplasmata archaeon]